MFESSLGHMDQVSQKKTILSNLLKRCRHRNIKTLNGFEKSAEQLKRQHFGAADISDTFAAFAPGQGLDRHHQRTFAFCEDRAAPGRRSMVTRIMCGPNPHLVSFP